MMLCGQISIELTVDDFVEAADHQKRIEGLMATIHSLYPEATFTLRERRQRKALELDRAPVAPAASGATSGVTSGAALARYGEA